MLSKETRAALHEALANSETFFTQVLPPTNEECCYFHQVFSLPNITFSPKNMLVKNPSLDRPLYYTGYIGYTIIERIVIDPISTLSIMLVHLMQFLCITIHKLSITTTIIYGFKVST